MEALEPRALLDAIAWTGLGDGTNWHDPLNWDVNRLPAPGDDVTIEVADADPVIRFGLDGATHEVRRIESTERVQVEGGELRVDQIAHFSVPLFLMNGGIGSGVWEVDQGISSPSGRWTSRMSGPIEVRGDVELIQYGQLSVTGGLSLQGTMTIDSSSYLYFDGAQVVTSGNFVFLPTDGSNRYIRFRDGSGGTLEFAEGVTISGGAQDTAAISMEGNLPLTIVNRGTIRSEGYLATIVISGGTFENRGLIDAIDESRLMVLVGEFSNFSNVSATDAQLTIGYRNPWFNPGKIAVDNSLLVLDGQFAPDNVTPEHFTRVGGKVELAGEVLNQGRTLLLDQGTGTWWMHGGVISGGVVETQGSARLVADSGGSGNNRLVGPITMRGQLDVPSLLEIEGDLTLEGEIRFLGGEILFEVSGGIHGGIIRGNSSITSDTIRLDGADPIQVLLDEGIQIIGDKSRLTLSHGGNDPSILILRGSLSTAHQLFVSDNPDGMTFVNEGVIELTPGSLAQIQLAEFRNEGHMVIAGSATFLGSWTSPGTVDVQGGTWILSGTTTTEGSGLRRMTRSGGTVELHAWIDNTGDVLVIDSATGPLPIRSARLTGGVIELRDGMRLSIGTDGAASTLVGVEVHGEVDVDGGQELRIENGITLLGTLSVFGVVHFNQPQTVTISLLEFRGGMCSFVYYATAVGELVLAEGTTIRVAETATWVTFHNYSTGGQIVRNRGRIEVYNAGQRVSFEDERFENEGMLLAAATSSVWIEETGDIDDASELVRGTWHVADQARLEFYKRQIIAIGSAARIVKSSPQAILLGLSAGLNRVDGAIELSDGAWIECRPAGGVLTLSGTLAVAGSGSFFEVNGDLVLARTAVLEFALAGGSLPLRATGLAALDGRLHVSLEAGFMLADGESADLIHAGATAGEFGGVTLPEAVAGNRHALRVADGTVEMFSTDLADANLDGVVDSRDFVLFLNWWGGGDSMADTNGDGAVDTRDVILFLSWWSDG